MIKSWIRCVLSLLITLPTSSNAASPEPALKTFAAHYDEFARQSVERLLTRGLTPADAFARLAAVHDTLADRNYLESLRPPRATNERIAMRSYQAIDRGYRITAPNGRTFTLAMVKDGVRINDRPVTLHGAGARAAIETVRAALTTTFVVDHLFRFALVSRAEAGSLREYILITVITAIASAAATITFPKEAPRTVSMIDFLRQSRATCDVERRSDQPFADSRSAEILALLAKAKVTDGPLDCASLAQRPLIFDDARTKRKVTIDTAAARELCDQMRSLIECLTTFRTAIERTATPGPSAAPDGATPRTGGSPVTGQ